MTIYTKHRHTQSPQAQPHLHTHQPPKTSKITKIKQPPSPKHNLQPYPQTSEEQWCRPLYTRILHNTLSGAPRRTGGGMGSTRAQMQQKKWPQPDMLKMPIPHKQHTHTFLAAANTQPHSEQSDTTAPSSSYTNYYKNQTEEDGPSSGWTWEKHRSRTSANTYPKLRTRPPPTSPP